MKNYIWDNDDLPTIRSATNIPGHDPINNRLVRNHLPIIRPSDDVPEENLPTIRSATNVPGHNTIITNLSTRLVRNNLPNIRPSENVPEENFPVIRSATNVPRSRVLSIKPLNALNFLASRMGVK